MLKPLDVDDLWKARPSLFPHAIPTISERRSVQVGETVKIVVGIREDEGLVRARWLTVESRNETPLGPQFVGRSWRDYGDDLRFDFLVQHIYRMEPREFVLWGTAGIPMAMRANTRGPDGKPAAFPVDRNEHPLEDCQEVILQFKANGRAMAERHYRKLASRHTLWLPFEDLK